MGTSGSKRDISPSSIVVAAKDQVSSDLAGEAVILSLESGDYYGLDEVGAQIWQLIKQPRSVAEIRDLITAEYDVDSTQCERDIIDFFRELLESGLVEVEDPLAA